MFLWKNKCRLEWTHPIEIMRKNASRCRYWQDKFHKIRSNCCFLLFHFKNISEKLFAQIIVWHRENEKMFEQFHQKKNSTYSKNVRIRTGKYTGATLSPYFYVTKNRVDVFVGCVWVFVRENDRHEDSSIVQNLTYLCRLSLTSFSQFAFFLMCFCHRTKIQILQTTHRVFFGWMSFLD